MIKKLSRSIREYKKESIISAILILIEVIMEVIIPLIIAFLIDEGITKGNSNNIWISSFLLLLVALISLISGSLSSIYSAKAGAGFAKNLRSDMFKNIQTFSFSNIDKFKTSSIITRLTTDVSYVQNAYTMIIRIALRAPFMLILSLISAFYINSKITIIYLIVMPILVLIFYIISNKAMPLFRELFKTYDDMNNVVAENVRGIRVVKSYVKEKDEIKKFNKVSNLIYKRFYKAESIVIWNMPVMQLAMYTCTVFIAFFGAKFIVNGIMTTGELTSLLSYTAQILSSLMMLSMIYVMLVISIASAERIREILDEVPDIKNPSNGIKKIIDGEIQFKNVSFGYKKDILNLKNINLDIKSGEVIGVIGTTASGKSTLVNLINRLYDVREGTILIGGVDIKEYDLKVLRDNISTVLQNNVLFKGSIKDNLKWGNKNLSDKEMRDACKFSCADEFINKLPNKYNYMLDQGATNLSGGQKQRLCIARSILKNPKILIMDDSTSAVDTKTDAKLRNNLKKYLPNVTKIIISERILSVHDANRVIVMDKGRIIDFDTPKNLLKNSKIYKDIYNSQKKGV